MVSQYLSQRTLLAALLGLGVASSAASAAEVQIKGLLDLGLNYSIVDKQGESESTFQMASGQNAMSRWSIEGEETLSPSLRVGFVLESGFSMDSGELASNLHKALFWREAQIYLTGDFGTFKMGRLASFVSGFNKTGLFGPKVSPFSASWLNVPGHKNVMTGDFTSLDNVLVYSTPTLAGWQGHLQYSFGMNQDAIVDGKWKEGSQEVDRTAAAALTYTNECLHGVVIVDTVAWGNEQTGEDLQDLRRVSLGGNVDLGAFKAFAAGQWFDGACSVAMAEIDGTAKLLQTSKNLAAKDGIDGFGVNVGVTIPVKSFLVKLSTGYMNAERTTRIRTARAATRPKASKPRISANKRRCRANAVATSSASK